jgi:hypothetical protein
MKHLMFAFGLALISLGCLDSADDGHQSRPLTCRDFRTCGSCTPVVGCGWCQIGDDGICVADPRECAVARSFTFNWEPAECPGSPPADGGATASDARSEAAPDDATASTLSVLR